MIKIYIIILSIILLFLGYIVSARVKIERLQGEILALENNRKIESKISNINNETQKTSISRVNTTSLKIKKITDSPNLDLTTVDFIAKSNCVFNNYNSISVENDCVNNK